MVQTGEVVAIKIISMKTLAKYGDEIKKVVSTYPATQAARSA